jgi:ankyrin repeat protein
MNVYLGTMATSPPVCNDDADTTSRLLITGTVSWPPALIDGLYSPVRLAIRLGKRRILERLLTVPVIDWSVSNLNLALELALGSNSEQIIPLLLDAGAHVDHPLVSGRFCAEKTALVAAIESGDVSMVKFLLDVGAEPNRRLRVEEKTEWPLFQSLLRKAVAVGIIEIVQLLLTAGANVNDDHMFESSVKLNRLAGTALQAAAELGHYDLVLLLLEAGADVNAPAAVFSGRTALQAAADKGRYEVVRLLGQAGADPDGLPAQNDGMTALVAAIRAGCCLTTKILLDLDADTGYRHEVDGSSQLPIQAAAKSGRIDLVNMLYERGADINAAAEESEGRTALQAAAEEGHLEVVDWLLARGAEVNAPPANSWGITALQAASEKGFTDIVHLLLEKGADVNAPASSIGGYTALEAASKAGALDIVYMLPEKGADVNAAHARGYTALESAAASGRLDIVRLLLNVGAETVGSRALEFAFRGGHEGVVEMLKDYDF